MIQMMRPTSEWCFGAEADAAAVQLRSRAESRQDEKEVAAPTGDPPPTVAGNTTDAIIPTRRARRIRRTAPDQWSPAPTFSGS